MGYIKRYLKEITTEPYEIGDVVRVRHFETIEDYKDLSRDFYGEDGHGAFADGGSIEKFFDRTGSIKYVLRNWHGEPIYIIDIDTHAHYFDNVLLEKISVDRMNDIEEIPL